MTVVNNDQPGEYVRIGTSLIRLDGARARLERAYQSYLRTFFSEIQAADLSDPDTFTALIQTSLDMRTPPGRLAAVCRVDTPTIRAWSRGQDLPPVEEMERVITCIRLDVGSRVRSAPDLSPVT